MTELKLQKQQDHEKDLARLRSFRPPDDKARYLKSDPKGVEAMCKIMEELREEAIQRGIEQGIEQSRIESIKSIMEGLKYTAQQAMDLLKIPLADRSRYLSMLK